MSLWGYKDETPDATDPATEALVNKLSCDTFDWKELESFSDYFVDEVDFDEEVSLIVEEAAVWIEEERRGFALKRTDSISSCSTEISECDRTDTYVQGQVTEIIVDMMDTLEEFHDEQCPEIGNSATTDSYMVELDPHPSDLQSVEIMALSKKRKNRLRIWQRN